MCPQAGNEPFNRAMLFNVGFKEAMKDLNWDCVIFHDVDHILENDRNYYGCGEMPRHFAVKLNKYSYMYVFLTRCFLHVWFWNVVRSVYELWRMFDCE